MNTNVNLEAAVGVLAFFGTGFVLLVLGLIFAYTLVVRKFGRAKLVLIAGMLVLGLYLGLMLLFSLSSREKALARGEEKYFCEIDCHLAYSVTGVRKTKTLGDAAAQATAKGDFYVVTLKTRFDEKTISSRRGYEPLHPNPRALMVSDEQGRKYPVSEEGQRALQASQSAGTQLDTPLRPGESYTTQLVFDLPPDAKDPALLINEADLPTRFVIGHENSLMHKRTMFRLEPQV
ncbi:MAG: DUF4352 domain-containing protein [Acidobacteria bacterium]|nr:DUF4352 domain-containing protein [Acidobacteriota bacterium]